MKVSKSVISIFISFVMIFSLFSVSFAVQTKAEGITYYIDSALGSDSNSGTSASSAWKSLDKVNATTFSAGSTILFKRGGKWDGILRPNGSGNASNYITISCYGDESDGLPIISNSAETYNNINTTVLLLNQSYWKISNLEIINTNADSEKYGIYIMSNSGVRIHHVTVSDCVVHGAADTWCTTTAKGNGMTGIIVSHGGSYWGYQDDITIENNTVYDCNGSGIVSTGSAGGSDQYGNVYENANQRNVIRGNYLRNVGQEGILVTNNASPLVEYNTVDGAHSSTTTSWHVAIWPFSSYNALFQYNEAYNTKTTKDGQGFDCDYQSYGTTFQYNYGHNNEGGFMLICCEPTNWDGGFAWNNNSVVRYNIGQNNSTVQFALTGQIDNTKIYNNTLYYTSGSSVSTYIRTVYNNPDKGPNNTQFYNNIFYNVNGGEYALSYTEGGVTGYAKNTVWQNNLFYGQHPSSEPQDSGKITADPMFIDAGGAKEGFDSCQVYYLKKGSPALGAGVAVENTCAYPCDTDFFGNPLSGTPNIGAYGGAGYDGVNVTTSGYTEVPTTAPTTEKDGDNSLYGAVCVWNDDCWFTSRGTNVAETFNNGYITIDATSDVSTNQFQIGTWKGGGFSDSDMSGAVGKTGIAVKVKIDRASSDIGNPEKLDVVLKLTIDGITYSYLHAGIPVNGEEVTAYFPFENFRQDNDSSNAMDVSRVGDIGGVEFDIVSYNSYYGANINNLKATVSPLYPYAESQIVQGDINQDGYVSSIDLLILKQYVLNTLTVTDSISIEQGDISGDGRVNSLDMLLLKRKVLGL